MGLLPEPDPAAPPPNSNINPGGLRQPRGMPSLNEPALRADQCRRTGTDTRTGQCLHAGRNHDELMGCWYCDCPTFVSGSKEAKKAWSVGHAGRGADRDAP